MSDIISGAMEISSGIVSSGMSVGQGGEVTVLSGGTVTDAEVSHYGYFWVDEGGFLRNVLVTESGNAFVSGSAENLTMETGGQADIYGGVLLSGTILNGGVGVIYEGATGSSVAVSSGGRYLIYGGQAVSTTVASGGVLTVQLDCGTAAWTTVLAGGSARIASDGVMSQTTLSGGRLEILDGQANNTTLKNGGEMIVLQDGAVTSATIDDGSITISGGTANNVTLGSSGGWFGPDGPGPFTPIVNPVNPVNPFTPIVNPVNPDNPIFIPIDPNDPIFIPIDPSWLITADSTNTISYTLNASTVAQQSLADAATESGEGETNGSTSVCELNVSRGGLAVNTIASKGLVTVFEGGTAVSTTLRGGTMHVMSGGLADGTIVSTGLVLAAGGTVTNTTVTIAPTLFTGGGILHVTDGGLADTLTVYGGSVLADNGGTVVHAAVQGGTLHVSKGGTADDTILKGGMLLATSATVTNTTVEGGTLYVSRGGAAEAVTMSRGYALAEGGVIAGATVTGGTVRIMTDAVLAGPFAITAEADAIVDSGGRVSLNIAGATPGAEAQASGLAYIWGAPIYTLTVSAEQEAGVYLLAQNVAGFRDAVTVLSVSGEELGTLTAGNTIQVYGQYYTLRVTDNVLNLTIASEEPAFLADPVSVYVNSEWAGLEEGAFVAPVPGMGATVGTDAFATGRDAMNAVAGDGTVAVAGGEASFLYGVFRNTEVWDGASVTGSTVVRNGSLTLCSGSYGHELGVERGGTIAVNAGAYLDTLTVTGGEVTVAGSLYDAAVYDRGVLTVTSGGVCGGLLAKSGSTLVVESGAHLTGSVDFQGETITVNGTIDIDITNVAPGTGSVFNNHGNLTGAPSFTVTVSETQAIGSYELAWGFAREDSAFTLLDTTGKTLATLTVGGGALIGEYGYTLKLDGGYAVLEISDGSEMGILYVNSEWAGLADGTLVMDNKAMIGLSAYGDIATATEHLKEGGTLILTGGTFASASISVLTREEQGAILLTDSTVTETGSLTLNYDGKAVNLTVDGALIMQNATADGLTVNGKASLYNYAAAKNLTVNGELVLTDGSQAYTVTAGEGSVVSGSGGSMGDVVTILSGSTITGQIKFKPGTVLTVDGLWHFDLAKYGATGSNALFSAETAEEGQTELNVERLALTVPLTNPDDPMGFAGTPEYLITISDNMWNSVYNLAIGIDGFDGAVFKLVTVSGKTIGMLNLNESTIIDDKYYMVSTLRENYLTLTVADTPNMQMAYVNSAWSTVTPGESVYTPDGPAIFGVNAFADVATAQNMLSDYGILSVTGGTFADAVITKNARVSNAVISGFTVSGHGSLMLNSGAKASDITVSAGSLLVVNSGAYLSVSSTDFFRTPGASVNVNGGTICFDVTGVTSGNIPFADALECGFSNGVELMADIGEACRAGTYSLVSELYDFFYKNNYIRVRWGNGNTGMAYYDGYRSPIMTQYQGITLYVDCYLTKRELDSALQLVVDTAVALAYVNTDWEGLVYGTTVTVGVESGGPAGSDTRIRTAIYGINAFSTLADGVDATDHSAFSSTVVVQKGTFTMPEGTDKHVINMSGGMLTDSTIDGGVSVSVYSSPDRVTLKDIVVDGTLNLTTADATLENITVNGLMNISLWDNVLPTDLHNVVIVSGGTLNCLGYSYATFTEDTDITVNGTLVLSTAKRIEGFSNIKGTPTDFILYFEKNFDTFQYQEKSYVLATGVTEFNGTIRIQEKTTYRGSISLGVTGIGPSIYTLSVTNGDLVLSVARSKTLYLNEAWKDLPTGTVVSVPNGPLTENHVIGSDAFGDPDEALAATMGLNPVNIMEGGTYSFAGTVTTTMVAYNATIHDSVFANQLKIIPYYQDIEKYGAPLLKNVVFVEGGRLTGKVTVDTVTFKAGSIFEFGPGFTLTGFCTIEDGADVTVPYRDPMGTPTVIFDLSLIEAGGDTPLFRGFSYLQGGDADYYITVTDTLEDGEYLLAAGACDFDGTLTVRNTAGLVYVSMSVGEKALYGDVSYTVHEKENGDLTLTVETFVPPDTVYVNTAWSRLDADTVVEVAGGTAVIGVDAFGDAATALSAAIDTAKVYLVGGSYKGLNNSRETIAMAGVSVYDMTVQSSLLIESGATAWNLQVASGAALTVEAGARLTGWAIFNSGADITVNGTMDFDISNVTTGMSYLYKGLSFVKGAPTYTLTVRDYQTLGTYALAMDVEQFDGTFTVKNSLGETLGRLTLGTTARINGSNYSLGLSGGILSVAIYVPEQEEHFASGDVDGNEISDVMFQYTGGDYQTGYWLNGTDEWQSTECSHPTDWRIIGSYDMDGDGKADAVFAGNTEVDGVKGAYIGYYKDGIDTDDNWVNIHFLENEEGNDWHNAVGNITGNPGKLSIAWYAPDLYALGVWTDGTSQWRLLSRGFGGPEWTMVGCADFDGDGRASVVMAYNDGQAFYAVDFDGTAFSMGALNWVGWTVRAIGDFAGDGRDDMVLFHQDTGTMVMLANGSADDFRSIGQLDPVDWFVVGAGDYNGDGKDDLLVRQYSTGMLGYYSAGDTANWIELGRGIDMDWTVIA